MRPVGGQFLSQVIDKPFLFHKLPCFVTRNDKLFTGRAVKVPLSKEDGFFHITLLELDVSLQFSQSIDIETIRIAPCLDVLEEWVEALDNGVSLFIMSG
jgi:hypothetical protein